MNFIRINWRLNELEGMTHHPFCSQSPFFLIIYFTSPLTPTLCIVHYINLFTLYWFVHNSRIVSIFKTHRERSCQKVREVWDLAHSHQVSGSHPSIVASSIAWSPHSHSLLVACVWKYSLLYIYLFIRTVWYECEKRWVSESEPKDRLGSWGARPAARLTVWFVWLDHWILIRSVLCEYERIN